MFPNIDSEKTTKKSLKRNFIDESESENISRLPLRKLKISDDNDQIETYEDDFLPMLIASIKELKEEVSALKMSSMQKTHSAREINAEKEATILNAVKYAKENSNLKAAKLFKVDASTIRRWRKLNDAKIKTDNKQLPTNISNQSERSPKKNINHEMNTIGNHKNDIVENEIESNQNISKSYFADAEVIFIISFKAHHKFLYR